MESCIECGSVDPERLLGSSPVPVVMSDGAWCNDGTAELDGEPEDIAHVAGMDPSTTIALVERLQAAEEHANASLLWKRRALKAETELKQAHLEAAHNALWNQANAVAFAIDQGRLDGTDAVLVAAAIRATAPEEFEKVLARSADSAQKAGLARLEYESRRIRAERAEAAVGRVRAKHSSYVVEGPMSLDPPYSWEVYTYCRHCQSPYPCPTIQAMDDESGEVSDGT